MVSISSQPKSCPNHCPVLCSEGLNGAWKLWPLVHLFCNALLDLCPVFCTLSWGILEVDNFLPATQGSFWAWNNKALRTLRLWKHMGWGNLQVQAMHSEPETLRPRLASWMGEGSLTVSPLSLAWSSAQGKKTDYFRYKNKINSRNSSCWFNCPFSLGPPFADFVNQRIVLLGWLWGKEVNTEDYTRFCN